MPKISGLNLDAVKIERYYLQNDLKHIFRTYMLVDVTLIHGVMQ